MPLFTGSAFCYVVNAQLDGDGSANVIAQYDCFVGTGGVQQGGPIRAEAVFAFGDSPQTIEGKVHAACRAALTTAGYTIPTNRLIVWGSPTKS